MEKYKGEWWWAIADPGGEYSQGDIVKSICWACNLSDRLEKNGLPPFTKYQMPFVPDVFFWKLAGEGIIKDMWGGYYALNEYIREFRRRAIDSYGR